MQPFQQQLEKLEKFPKIQVRKLTLKNFIVIRRFLQLQKNEKNYVPKFYFPLPSFYCTAVNFWLI